MPELITAPSDASVGGTEKLLTLDFQNISLTDLLAWLVANTDPADIPFSDSGFTAENVFDAIVEASSGSGVATIVAGTGITVDDTDPANPVVSATGGGGADSVTIVTEASAFTASPSTHAGLSTYVRAGGDVTFDDAQSYTAGEAYNIRATGDVDLLEDGVTLTPPSGGTLSMTSGMAVTVIMTSSTAGDVIGQTVASS